jgi:hypothetical protein
MDGWKDGWDVLLFGWEGWMDGGMNGCMNIWMG